MKFERLLETYLTYSPRGFTSFRMALPLWLREKLFQKSLIAGELKALEPKFDWQNRLLFCEHHLSHAASAFYPSPFDRAAVLTLDGVGEWTTTAVAVGEGNNLAIHKEIHFPHSLGLLYSAFTYYTGFKVNSGEYKLMGLAPYGEPRYVQDIRDNLIDLKPDGSFRLNLDYFNYCTGLTMTNERFHALFGAPPRDPESLLTQKEMDLAASIQAVLEEVVLRLTRSLAAETGMENLCLAGGVALNCVANGKILRDGKFRNIWIQPAAGDAGGALGAALATYYLHAGKPRSAPNVLDDMSGAYLGPAFDQARDRAPPRQRRRPLPDLDTGRDGADTARRRLPTAMRSAGSRADMEFGPRALGNRSIIADPRNTAMQKNLNLKVKYRESFRPFAPSVLRDHCGGMVRSRRRQPLHAARCRRRCGTQATDDRRRAGIVRHRQTQRRLARRYRQSPMSTIRHACRPFIAKQIPSIIELIERFHALTGCPVLVNTSFNVRSEPIVCTPEDAFRCFMGTDIDMLGCRQCVLRKEEQDPALKVNYKDQFELD